MFGTAKSYIRPTLSFLLVDPRHYQITVLSSLILLGIFHFSFYLPWWHVTACIGTALVTQFVGDRWIGRHFEPRSALISALSLTILLRTGSVALSILAAILAISSKYILRYRGKHIFNPANFGLVIVSLLFTSAWISPGQWGTAPLFAVLLAGMGGIVTGKARRWDISLGFLAIYAGLLAIRAVYLGDPWSIPLHQIQNGAILIFAFFMISDPKTTPNARTGRIVYAAFVAMTGFFIQFYFHNAAGIILALIITAPIVPLLDHLFAAQIYRWPRLPRFSTTLSQSKGVSYETSQIPAE